MPRKAAVLHVDFNDHPLYTFVDDVTLSEVLRTLRHVGTATVSTRGDFAYDWKGCLEGQFTIEFEAMEHRDADDLDDLYTLLKRFIKNRVRHKARVFERDV